MCIRVIWEAPKKIKEACQERKRRKEEDDEEIEKLKNEDFSQANLKKNLMGMRPRVFVEYIDFHFPLDGQIYKTYKSKIKTLRSLDEDVLSNAIARTKGLEKIYETKYITYFVGATLTATVPTILFVSELLMGKIKAYLFVPAFSLCILLLILLDIIKDKNVTAALVSFQELLEQALAKKDQR